MSPASPPAEILALWRDRKVSVLTAAEQIDEIARVTRYSRIRAVLPPALAGRLVNRLRDVATVFETLPAVDRCSDPDDHYLLALTAVGEAHFLVTGDKPLLALKSHQSTQIVTPAALLAFLRKEK